MYRIMDLRTRQWLRIEGFDLEEGELDGDISWMGWVRQEDRATRLETWEDAMDAVETADQWAAFDDGAVGIVKGQKVMVGTPSWPAPPGTTYA